MNTPCSMEPSWWRDPDAAAERRALIEGFDVRSLEDATARLRERCAVLDRRHAAGEAVRLREVVGVLVGQWSVSFLAELADAQREFFGGDQGRLASAAEQGRKAAVAVRDRYLASDRIDRGSLQYALSVASGEANRLRASQNSASSTEPNPGLVPTTAVEYALDTYQLWHEARARATANADDVFYARVALLARARLVQVYGDLSPVERALLADALEPGDLAGLQQAHRLVVDNAGGHVVVRRVYRRTAHRSM